MTIEQLEESNWLVYKVLRGSHCHGLATEKSDKDYTGIYIQPTEQILRGDYIPQIACDKNDEVYYEIERYLQLASTGNPNTLELINVDDEFIVLDKGIIEKHVDKNIFITKELKSKFAGYAIGQMRKAKSKNKMMNWDKQKVVRKSVLDFCYVLLEKEKSVKFKKWKEIFAQRGSKNSPIELANEKTIGLAKVNNFPNTYSMYYLGENNGGMIKILGNESNDLQVRNIPKDVNCIARLHFDRDAYSSHCKDYRNYTNWIKKRNKERYNTNVKHGQDFDSKSFCQCLRLLYTALDIPIKKQIIVNRSEQRDYLLGIKAGKRSFESLMNEADQLLNKINTAFDKSDLPIKVDKEVIKNILLKIRLENL